MDYLTVEEIAAKLRVAEKTVRRWINSGQLEAVRAGRFWRIKPADLEAFLQSSKEVPSTKKADGLAALTARPVPTTALSV